MATVIGGVDALYFNVDPTLPYGSELIRLSRNIHYILKYESNLNHRIDPVYGSYNLEYMTEVLATKVWKKIGGMDHERASV
jgi:methylmalonyl-CoA mutase N-terminal domain/subunit